MGWLSSHVPSARCDVRQPERLPPEQSSLARRSPVPRRAKPVAEAPKESIRRELSLVLAVGGQRQEQSLPGGTYFGNYFAGDVSTTGGVEDRANNVEQVLIQNPEPDDWTISVVAFRAVPSQGYAVVATAGMEELDEPDVRRPEPPPIIVVQ